MSPVIEARDLVKQYKIHSGLWRDLTGRKRAAQAVSGVSFTVEQGQVLGLVGESGCGKTTLGKLLLRLERPSGGSLRCDGQELAGLRGAALRQFRRTAQMVFQDPFDSLSPRLSILEIVTQPLRYLNIGANAAARRQMALEALSRVELLPVAHFAHRLPHQLSGGQRQRVAIARALVVSPRFIVADEPVSMLDVSVRASVLNLLQRLNRDTGIAMLLITHDLATAVFLCDRIMVMYLGRLVESLPAQDFVARARHPYTRRLLDCVPDLLRDTPPDETPETDMPSAIDPPGGCRFHPRCPIAIARCAAETPVLHDIADTHSIACHLILP
jgi:peptide/nickel transport system ATP-binding protein